MRTALTIAGSDCSGGAGIQADLKTMMANGVYAMSVITALTAQNTMGVSGIMEVTPEFLKKQLDAVFTDIKPDAVKIGMVFGTPQISAVAAAIQRYQPPYVVLDPVMVATSGDALLQKSAEDALKEMLFPLAALLTPNLPEAERLIGCKISTVTEMETAAEHLGETYHTAVLIKGGHYMGLGEMMGMKNVKLELKGNYATLADLLEAMKDIQFEAGVPELTKHGIGAVIVFPPVDRNNQVWITGAKGKFTIMRSAEVAGLGNMAKNAVLDTLTDGWSSMSGAFGNKKKRCMELVDITAKEIKEAGI